MIKYIHNPDAITLLKPDGELHYGCDQEWYPSKWQRMSGCGPTAASNLYLYNMRDIKRYRTFDEGLEVMEEIWHYVTPRFGGGVNTTKIFTDGFTKLLKEKGREFTFEVLEVPQKKTLRRPISEVREFMTRAIEDNLPIAFLNLHNGEEVQLDSWHWVTVVGIETSPKDELYLDIFDAGKLISVNLDHWYAKTKKGGGFVVYRIQP
jgi:hypothetical protein